MAGRGEKWAPVPGWDGYEASTRGRVRSVGRALSDSRQAGGVILKPAKDKDGYRHVTLSAGRRRQRVHVARLVLLTFVGEPPEGHEALHGNGRRWDNRLANLRWGSKPENRADRERHRAERTAGETGVTAPCPVLVVSSDEGSRR